MSRLISTKSTRNLNINWFANDAFVISRKYKVLRIKIKSVFLTCEGRPSFPKKKKKKKKKQQQQQKNGSPSH